MAKYLDYDGLIYLWGKIKATFAPLTHSHTKSQITDFPSSMTPTSHAHGNLTNDGKLTSTAAMGNAYSLLIGGPTGDIYKAGVAFSSASADAKNVLKQSGAFAALEATDIWYDTNVTVDEAITGKVDKVSGKGLSTNDYTTTEKNKLAGIASGAEANVQSDWSQTTTTADDYIKNKPTVAGASYNSTEATLVTRGDVYRWDQVYGLTSSQAKIGQGYGECSTATATTKKVATISNFNKVVGGLVAIKFSNDVAASATLGINDTAGVPIYLNGAAIPDGVINAGDIALFMYDGTNYVLVGKSNPLVYVTSSTAFATVKSLVEQGFDVRFYSGDFLGHKKEAGEIYSISRSSGEISGIKFKKSTTSGYSSFSNGVYSESYYEFRSTGSNQSSTSSTADTKNTAGSTDTSSKIFLIGATEQGANPQTYSHDTAYVGADGCLYSGGTKVLTSHQSLAAYAPKASPALSGTPTAPTAAAGTNTTQLATTAFVQNAVSTAVAGGVAFQGTAPTPFEPTNYTAGWYWIVGTANTYAGETCEVGDMIFCNTSSTTYDPAHFDVLQTNMTTLTTSEIDTAIAAANAA